MLKRYERELLQGDLLEASENVEVQLMGKRKKPMCWLVVDHEQRGKGPYAGV